MLFYFTQNTNIVSFSFYTKYKMFEWIVGNSKIVDLKRENTSIVIDFFRINLELCLLVK